jgi:hypothetical protein
MGTCSTAEVVECLPRKHKALSSNGSNTHFPPPLKMLVFKLCGAEGMGQVCFQITGCQLSLTVFLDKVP